VRPRLRSPSQLGILCENLDETCICCLIANVVARLSDPSRIYTERSRAIIFSAHPLSRLGRFEWNNRPLQHYPYLNMCLHRARPVSYVFCFILVCTAPVAAITWEQCLRNIRLESENNGLYLTNRTWFLPGSISENPLLTLKGCEALCGGPSPHFYDDAGSILNAWVLPALVRRKSLARICRMIVLTPLRYF
jgi:hypothetical protein